MTQLAAAPTTASPALELLDLREQHDERLLRSLYDGIFTRNFPLAEERESFETIRDTLWGDERDHSPRCHFIAARRHGTPVAVAACEYYARSNCGLLSYIAVDHEYRDKKLSRVLLTDPGMGVVRHVDAGYERAAEVARERGVHIPMLER